MQFLKYSVHQFYISPYQFLRIDFMLSRCGLREWKDRFSLNIGNKEVYLLDEVTDGSYFTPYSAPSVLFLDEVENLCPAGEHKSRGNKDMTPAVVRGIQALQVWSDYYIMLIISQPLKEDIGGWRYIWIRQPENFSLMTFSPEREFPDGMRH